MITYIYYLYSVMKLVKFILASLFVCFLCISLQESDNPVQENIIAENSNAGIVASSMGFTMPVHLSIPPSGRGYRSVISNTYRNIYRVVSQTSWQSSVNNLRNGFILKSSGRFLQSNTTIFFESLMAFPSGIKEPHHHLACLRKFII